jgi:thiamine biosynthesis lipoprotein ApbE
VTVSASTVIDAEMAAKTVLILGGEEGMMWLKTRPTFAGYLIYKNGEVKLSETMVQHLRWSK